MLVTFFDSFRYVGHLFPVALFRIFVGYFFLDMAVGHFQGDFLQVPQLSAMIQQNLPASDAPMWLHEFLAGFVVSQWQAFSYVITYIEFIIGFSFILGFMVRPVSLLAILLCFNFVYITDVSTSDLYKFYIIIFITMGWIGAGRCLGMDFYFFKRHRGIWW